MKIAVIGAGNGGQAMAGHLAIKGYDVSIYDRNKSIVEEIKAKGGISLQGKINGFGIINNYADTLKEAVQGAEIVMIVTTANAHGILAEQLFSYLEENQVVILNPGRTGGALEFREVLSRKGFYKKIYIAEAQTLVYACRVVKPGIVNIIGIKDTVLLSALPASETDHILSKIVPVYPCFKPAGNVLVTSLENIGPVFHPSVVLFNAALIERGGMFYFYRDMTPYVAEFIEKVDAERVAVGKVYGIDLVTAKDWIAFAYNDVGEGTLCDRMKNNSAYYDILAPSNIRCRQLMEDIPTGILPIWELGTVAGLQMKLCHALIVISSSLLGINFFNEGRTMKKMGLGNLNTAEIIKSIEE